MTLQNWQWLYRSLWDIRTDLETKLQTASSNGFENLHTEALRAAIGHCASIIDHAETQITRLIETPSETAVYIETDA